MIGLDRPLKPEWIYETLKMVKIGDPFSKYNEPFEDIAKELVGKEGKRKVRTVLFRSFFHTFQEKRTKVEPNLFLRWVNEYSYEELVPLFFVKILMDYEITRFITKKIDVSMNGMNHFSSVILSKKMVQNYGDRDVVRRSVRSFLKTLVHFDLITQVSTQKYLINRKLPLTKDQVRCLLILYAQVYLKSKVIDLKNFDTSLLYFFQDIDFQEIGRFFHPESWEFIRETGRMQLLMKV